MPNGWPSAAGRSPRSSWRKSCSGSSQFPHSGHGVSLPIQGVPQNFDAVGVPSSFSTTRCQAGRRCLASHGSSFLTMSLACNEGLLVARVCGGAFCGKIGGEAAMLAETPAWTFTGRFTLTQWYGHVHLLPRRVISHCLIRINRRENIL